MYRQRVFPEILRIFFRCPELHKFLGMFSMGFIVGRTWVCRGGISVHLPYLASNLFICEKIKNELIKRTQFLIRKFSANRPKRKRREKEFLNSLFENATCRGHLSLRYKLKMYFRTSLKYLRTSLRYT